MRLRIAFSLVLVCLSVFAFPGPICPATADDLFRAGQAIEMPALDTSSTRILGPIVIKHHDLQISIDSGKIAFFEPILIDSQEIVYGGYFEGEARFAFHPSLTMEREQLQRFFHSDSLNRPADNLFLLFTAEIYDQLATNSQATAACFGKDQRNRVIDICQDLQKLDKSDSYAFEALRNNLTRVDRPFVYVSAKPHKCDRIVYMFNPYLREEVKFKSRFREPGREFMEPICSYSQYAHDGSYVSINGRARRQLRIEHYFIDSHIDNKGDYAGMAEVTLEITSGPAQLIPFLMHPQLHLDSILDSASNRIEYVRYDLDVTFEDWETGSTYLFFDRPLSAGEKLKLRFYSNGKIAEQNLGVFYVTAGANWYPRYEYADRAVFDMRFKTDKYYEFVATGRLISQETSKDTLITTWKVLPAAKNVSFSIGPMKKYLFEEAGIAPVEVYYSEALHNSLAKLAAQGLIAAGRDMEKQVATDVINSMRLFQHYFGPYPHDDLKVTEIMSHHGEAFPGFLHLGFSTWLNTDAWGSDQIFRAHEVAHQWWGAGVGFETYHDQWLSEGLAEYSSLLYYQAIDNRKFLDKLGEYRSDIFSARKYLFGSGEESGPIALGYRTSSTRTEGDYGLIVYKKGAFVFHMLRNLMIDFKTMNEEPFFNMMKEFYQSNRGRDVTTAQFKALVEKHVGMDMTWFFNQWIFGTDLPTFEFSYGYEPQSDNTYTARCRITTEGASESFKMYVPVEIDIDSKNKAYLRVMVEGPQTEFTLPGLPSKPKRIVLNPFESVLARVKQ